MISPSQIVFYPYSKGKFYLHGGLSIQETLVPVISSKLTKKARYTFRQI